LFPAIAVAQALSRKEPDASILFAGRRDGIEARTVAGYGMPFVAIPAAPLYTERVWRNWTLPLVLGAALYQCWRLLDRFKPDVVLGTGGYVSVPLITAAGLARVPIVLQEQNLMPGRATRVLARFARTVATAYPESSRFLRASTTVVTGTPVRTEFWRRKDDFPAQPRTILVLGGSQGAHRLNQALADLLPSLLDRPGLAIMHQTGPREIGAMQAVNASNRKGKTLVTGMNGVPPALRAVKEENLAMTVELNPTEWGRLGVDVLASFLKGDKVDPRVFIKHVIIDNSNIDAKLPKT